MVTVERVLPWRREKLQTMEQIKPLIKNFTGENAERQIDVVSRAFKMAADAHSEQRRRSGEPYIVHPLAVATIVAGLGLDEVTIAAALLHDAVEDTRIESDDIQRAFGNDVAVIVEGVTKLDRLKFHSKEEQQAASFRKMLVAMAKDIRVLIIKLCDRLHNLRTVAAMPEWKQARMARETLEIYAPLAHRLGMEEIKTQLEDISFAALHPKRYSEIDHMVSIRSPEREVFIWQMEEEVKTQLARAGVTADVSGRDKHLYSIYNKMVVKNKEFDQINDLIGVRVIVETVRNCYAALGSVHAEWKPVAGRFKDYIAMPKFNLYQSLHTTVVGPGGRVMEFQIRTRSMHERAESGVASHFAYKDGVSAGEPQELAWLSRMIDWEKEASDPEEFLQNLKVDLETEEVFVFTPQGEVLTLPVGSTPVDFAYAIHTDVGHRCVGARVDGDLVQLSERLFSGQTVEIFTSKTKGAGPSHDWLRYATSQRAKSKIKQWFNRERREGAIRDGQENLSRALRREGLNKSDLAKAVGGGNGKGHTSESALEIIAQSLNYQDLESLYHAVGDGQLTPDQAARRIGAEIANLATKATGRPLETPARPEDHTRTPRRELDSAAVRVEGYADVFVRLSRCCKPIPGDSIVGFVTRGRGVSIHRTDCANAETLATSQADRLIDVEWDDPGKTESYIVSLGVKAYDRSGLLADVCRAVSDEHINILGSSSVTTEDRIATLAFDFQLMDYVHLEWLMRVIRRVDGVYDVFREVPGQN